MTPLKALFSLLLALICTAQVLAQAALEGTVLDEDGTPVGYANLYFTELSTGTSTDEAGTFFLRLPTRGDYVVVVSALGYASLTDTVIVGDATASYAFTLQSSAAQLKEIVVSAGKRDPAYAIIAQAAERRKNRLADIESYRVQVYLKAREDVETFETKRERRKRERKEAKGDTVVVNAGPVATVSTGNREDAVFGEIAAASAGGSEADKELLESLNLVESQLTLNYQAPRSFKEERQAFKASGDKAGLLVPLFGDGDFDFYRSQVDFGSLADLKLLSPLAPTAVLSYKFKLLSTKAETVVGGSSELVYEIEIESRRSGDATVEGTIWINDGSFTINRLDVVLPQGALKFLDQLRFEQSYGLVSDSTWMPVRQVFSYQTKEGKKKSFEGKTTIRFSAYELGVAFPQNFFRGELAVTEAEAYKRDSLYWQQARPEALEEDEAVVVRLRDSITARRSSPEFQDSLQAAFNEVKLLEVIWDGVGFRRWRRREQIFFGSIPSWISFNVVGGFRVGPFLEYARTYPNGKRLYTNISASVGLSDQDILGNYGITYRYAPKRLGRIGLDIDRAYEAINPFDAILNQLQRSNYYLVNRGRLAHSIEIFNGFYADASVGFAERLPAPMLSSATFLADLIEDEAPIDFEPFDAFTTELGVHFTPFQRYITEPTQKVVIGSAWPTIGARWKRGHDGVFGSSVDYDYLELSLSQNVVLGPLGNLRYTSWAGQFVNTNNVPFIDIKRFPRSNPLLFSQPLRSFQLLDTALTTTKPFFEFHALHHFNGAFLNNLPLIRLTGIELVAGGGFMYLTDGEGFRQEEVLAGMERVFKIGARRRLRLGVYGVLANSSAFRSERGIKFSLDVIDTWKKDWSF